MTGYWIRRAGPIAIGWMLALPAGVMGQVVPNLSSPAGNQNVPAAVMMANPYLNPYMNPYLNPVATQGTMSAGNAALYLYSANAARGGIGSGRLSQSRATAPRPKVAEMPDGASSPGGGAAKYFNPGPVNVNGAGRYYNGRRGYFQNNRR